MSRYCMAGNVQRLYIQAFKKGDRHAGFSSASYRQLAL